MKTRLLLSFSLSLSLLFSLLIDSVHATEQSIHVIVNGRSVQTDSPPFIESGTTYVPIRLIEQIEGLNIESWDNQNKTLVISSTTGSNLILKVGNQNATKDQENIKLSTPPVIVEGRTMVPLRFIAEAFNSDVAWNSYENTVYVAKVSEELKQQLNNSNLNESRIAAMKLPTITVLNSLEYTKEEALRNLKLYFPEGKSSEFFILQGGVITYYQVGDNAARAVWTAALNDKNNGDSLSFLPNQSIEKEFGDRPEVKTDIIFYDISTHAGIAEYGRINENGDKKILGKVEDMLSLEDLFPIPGETFFEG